MFSICWFYCIPFFKVLFFVFSPFLLIFSFFVLKRGVRQSRKLLRQFSFVLTSIAVVKIFIVDLYLLKEALLCGISWLSKACNPTGFKILYFLGFVAMVLSGWGIMKLHDLFIHERAQKKKTMDRLHLKLWGRISSFFVALSALWVIAPWLGFLTVGSVPDIFIYVPWQHLAFLNLCILLLSFWKLEDCLELLEPVTKPHRGRGGRNRKDLNRVWTPKDTIWLSATFFVVIIIFSFISHDILSGTSMQSETQIESGVHAEYEHEEEGFNAQ